MVLGVVWFGVVLARACKLTKCWDGASDTLSWTQCPVSSICVLRLYKDPGLNPKFQGAALCIVSARILVSNFGGFVLHLRWFDSQRQFQFPFARAIYKHREIGLLWINSRNATSVKYDLIKHRVQTNSAILHSASYFTKSYLMLYELIIILLK